MNDPFKQHGAFSWCELMTPDVETAKAFYGKLLGWQMQDMAMQGMMYTVLNAGGAPVGGIMASPKQFGPMPPHWATYVTVENVDATAEQAVALGGLLMFPPRDIPGVGRICLIQDPQGALFYAITYAAPETAQSGSAR
jgi:predicted enzyme related to lactoylglutathione lyase